MERWHFAWPRRIHQVLHEAYWKSRYAFVLGLVNDTNIDYVTDSYSASAEGSATRTVALC